MAEAVAAVTRSGLPNYLKVTCKDRPLQNSFSHIVISIQPVERTPRAEKIRQRAKAPAISHCQADAWKSAGTVLVRSQLQPGARHDTTSVRAGSSRTGHLPAGLCDETV